MWCMFLDLKSKFKGKSRPNIKLKQTGFFSMTVEGIASENKCLWCLLHKGLKGQMFCSLEWPARERWKMQEREWERKKRERERQRIKQRVRVEGREGKREREEREREQGSSQSYIYMWQNFAMLSELGRRTMILCLSFEFETKGRGGGKMTCRTFAVHCIASLVDDVWRPKHIRPSFLFLLWRQEPWTRTHKKDDVFWPSDQFLWYVQVFSHHCFPGNRNIACGFPLFTGQTFCELYCKTSPKHSAQTVRGILGTSSRRKVKFQRIRAFLSCEIQRSLCPPKWQMTTLTQGSWQMECLFEWVINCANAPKWPS